MGETGLARAPRLIEKIIQDFKMADKSSSAPDTLDDLIARGFVEDYSTIGGLNVRPPEVMEVTALGQIVYMFLTGKEAVPSKFAIKKEH